MDLILFIGIATALLVVIITLYFLQKKSSKPAESHGHHRPVPVRAAEGIPRRAQIARNQRNRLRNDAAEDGPVAAHVMTNEKMGAKKRAKLEAKAGKRVHRKGFQEGEAGEKENLLAGIIQYVKDKDIVVLEDLATHFKLKKQQAIDRITELQANGSLTGVIDGREIYISEEGLLAVAKFMKQYGRVSIAGLAESSNN